MSFPRYSRYKDSGVEWLGEVPEHWEVKRADAVLTYVREIARVADFRSETVFHYSIPAIQETGDGMLEDGASIASDKIALTGGELLVSKLNPRKGVVLVSEPHAVPTVCSTEFVPMRADGCDLQYAYWLYASEPVRDLISSTVRSVTRSHQRANPEDIIKLWLCFPPRDEQGRIAAVLDRETAKIDVLISEQQRLIALLKEKRQAVISHAVTRGLNPDAPMKPSGVEWLGDVPAHWEVISLGRVTHSRCDGPFGSGLKSDHYTEVGARVIRLQNIRSGYFADADTAFVDLAYFHNELNSHDVEAGDLLIAGLGDERNTVGRACVAPADIAPALVKADCFRFRLDTSRVTPDFAAAQLSAGAPADAGILASGSTRSRIPLSVMATRKLALPPLWEQHTIVACIQERSASLDDLLTEAERAITLLQERRTALISAAVTGKIDVRGLAEAA